MSKWEEAKVEGEQVGEVKMEEGGNETSRCISLHLQPDSLVMNLSGDIGSSSFPGSSTGRARYAKLPDRGTGRREEGTLEASTGTGPQLGLPLQLQPLQDGQVQIRLLLTSCNYCCPGLPVPEGLLLVARQDRS